MAEMFSKDTLASARIAMDKLGLPGMWYLEGFSGYIWWLWHIPILSSVFGLELFIG